MYPHAVASKFSAYYIKYIFFLIQRKISLLVNVKTQFTYSFLGISLWWCMIGIRRYQRVCRRLKWCQGVIFNCNKDLRPSTMVKSICIIIIIVYFCWVDCLSRYTSQHNLLFEMHYHTQHWDIFFKLHFVHLLNEHVLMRTHPYRSPFTNMFLLLFAQSWMQILHRLQKLDDKFKSNCPEKLWFFEWIDKQTTLHD